MFLGKEYDGNVNGGSNKRKYEHMANNRWERTWPEVGCSGCVRQPARTVPHGNLEKGAKERRILSDFTLKQTHLRLELGCPHQELLAGLTHCARQSPGPAGRCLDSPAFRSHQPCHLQRRNTTYCISGQLRVQADMEDGTAKQ